MGRVLPRPQPHWRAPPCVIGLRWCIATSRPCASTNDAAELAGHLEDAYDSALRSGCTEAEAIACAMERVPDWRALAVAVDRSTDEDSTMTRQAITVLLPGTTILLTAATGLSFVVDATPAVRWVDPRWHVHALAAGLAFLFYLLLGAIGAAWSRHVGGSPGERLAAGVFPLVLHVAVAGPAVVADMLFAFSRGGGACTWTSTSST